MPDMPHKDLNLGTAVHETEAQPVAAPDMTLYWYPPGKTEPELRPVAAAPAVEPAAAPEGEEQPSASEPVNEPSPEVPEV